MTNAWPLVCMTACAISKLRALIRSMISRHTAAQRRGGRGDQRVRAQVLVGHAEVQAVGRDLAADLLVRPRLAQAERLAQVCLERGLPGLGRALPVHPWARRLWVGRPVTSPGD